MDMINGLGLIAGTLTTIAFLPQLLKTWQSRSAEDISLGMLSTFCSGVFLWILYGLSIQSVPVVLANFVTLLLALMILILKFRFR